jgi:hypothetical protein
MSHTPQGGIARLTEELEPSEFVGTRRVYEASKVHAVLARLAAALAEQEQREQQPLNARADVLQALKPFAYAYESLMREAHDALQVGGYVPTEDTATTEVPVGWLRIAYELVTPAKEQR